MLHEAGARLIVTDVNDENLARVVNEFDVVTVSPGEIFAVHADIFSPCALGGVINDRTISELKVQIVAGAANNQLLDEQHGEMLKERNILYVPDYLANAGGIFNGCTELLGWEPARALQKVDQIYDSVLTILENANTQGITTNEAANRLAEDRIRRADSDFSVQPLCPLCLCGCYIAHSYNHRDRDAEVAQSRVPAAVMDSIIRNWI